MSFAEKSLYAKEETKLVCQACLSEGVKSVVWSVFVRCVTEIVVARTSVVQVEVVGC